MSSFAESLQTVAHLLENVDQESGSLSLTSGDTAHLQVALARILRYSIIGRPLNAKEVRASNALLDRMTLIDAPPEIRAYINRWNSKSPPGEESSEEEHEALPAGLVDYNDDDDLGQFGHLTQSVSVPKKCSFSEDDDDDDDHRPKKKKRISVKN